MIEKIITSLKSNNIDKYLINIVSETTTELFFIKKVLDMKRMKDVTKYEVTVYNDFEKDDKTMRGSAVCQIYPDMTDEEISYKLTSAYHAASFVLNPFYSLPSATENMKDSKIANPFEIENAVKSMTDALFAEDIDSDCFINSAEVFITNKDHRIISSEQIDVSYEQQYIEGELVIQCTTPDDVETYQDFYYDGIDTDSLRQKVKDTIELTRHRANASKCNLNGKIRVILSGQYTADLLDFYVKRANASLIYPGYSNFTINSQVQSSDICGDSLNISLNAKVPYSNEGIQMNDIPLLENGILKNIHGNSRFCYYMNTKPTGEYSSFKVKSGTHSMSDLKQTPYLHIVNFSDFQMDALSGRFGGEFRLAFYNDGTTIVPLTGGSISGSILDLANNVLLSKETQKSRNYEGPLAIAIENVQI